MTFKFSPYYLLLILLFLPISAFGQDSAYPLPNDNASFFLKRWQRNPSVYMKDFLSLNKNTTANQSLELGKSYQLPPLKKKDFFDADRMNYLPLQPYLLGDRYKNHDQESDSFEGSCFFILSGHGGPDPGAIANVDGVVLSEDEYAYDVSLRIARNLMMRGATVYMIVQDEMDGIRSQQILPNSNTETCMGDVIPRSQVERLKQGVDRINYLNERDKNLYRHFRTVSIHVDSRNEDKNIDVFFYHSFNAYSQKMASIIRNVFQEKYDKFQPGRGFEGTVSNRDLYILRNIIAPSTLIELANIQNPTDRVRIMEENNRQALANWITLGLERDYESNK